MRGMLEGIIDIIHSLAPGLAVLVVLVTIHEYGHWFFLRRYNVFVDKFSVGFGKPLYMREDKHGTQWMIAPLFFGGYVSFPYTMKDVPDRAKKRVKSSDVFNNKKPLQRAAVMFGGPLVNIVFAFACVMAVSLMLGVPKTTLEQDVAKLSLNKGDRVMGINGCSLPREWLFVTAATLTIDRGGKEETVTLPTPSPLYALGLQFAMERGNVAASLDYGLKVFCGDCCRLWESIRSLFTGNLNKLGGMPSILKAAASRWEKGGQAFWLFVGMLSLTLGVLNLLPLPGLDGGHLLLLLISVMFRGGRPFPERVEKYIIYASLLVLMSVIIFVNIRDILRLEWVQQFIN